MSTLLLVVIVRTMFGSPRVSSTVKQREHLGPRWKGAAAVVAIVASSWIGLAPMGSAGAAAAAKKSSAKPVFTAKQVAGKYRWVKSTVLVKFDDGKTGGGEIPYGANDTITFVAKAVPGTKALGTFTQSAEGFGSSKGTWYIQDGTVLVWISEQPDEVDNAYSFRRIDQLDKKRMTLSADDRLILRTYTENGLNEIGGRKVVGGSAYDELVRVS
jgi:hypothetical protein